MILIDNMFSYKLKSVLSGLEETNHVTDLGLEKSYDLDIWKYAKENDCSILTKDSDFIDLQNLKGYPPKIIMLKSGNVSMSTIIQIIDSKSLQIKDFLIDDKKGVLFL